jgi:molybdopterin/thiamine biosynthesis adenylyltransferase
MLGTRVCIVDCGQVEAANLGNQSFSAGSIGHWKSEVRARQIREINPDADVRVFTARVEDLGLAAFASSDVILTGLDSWRSRLHVNELSQRLGIPWIDAALDGSGQRAFGRVAVFDPRRTDSACFACRFDGPTLASMTSDPGSSACPSWRSAVDPPSEPTLQTSAVATVVGGFQTLWGIRLLLGGGEELVNQTLLIDCAVPPRVEQISIERSPRCVHHAELLEPLRPARGETVGALLSEARRQLGGEPEELRFHRRSLVRGLRCPGCGATRDVVRLSHAFADDELRCDCRTSAEMEPLDMVERLWAGEAQTLAKARWAELGFPDRDVVTAISGDRALHFIVGSDDAPTCGPTAEGICR